GAGHQTIPPSFTKKLTKIDQVLGSSIHMECKVSGSLPITAKWYKDGKEIYDSAKYKSLCHENTVSMEVSNLELADTANYTCSVTNIAGSDSCSAVLTVKGLELFTSSLNCSRKIHLLKHNCSLTSLNNIAKILRILSVLDCSLWFSNIPSAKDLTKHFFPLKTVEPASFLVKPENQQAVPNSVAEFKAVLKGTPPFAIKWFKEDLELVSGANCFIGIEGSTGFLTLYSVDVSKSGHYTCQVSNDVGSDSCTATLLVTEPPKFVKKLEASKVVKRGDSARFECKISGSPEIRVVWYRNDNEIIASEKFRMSFSDSVAVIEMNHLSTEDSGDYICEAHNPAGRASCSTKVIVKEPPVFSRKPSPVDMLKGTDVSLECEISGTPPFEVTWYKDKRQIRSSKKYKVTSKNYHASIHVLNVDASDIGEYQCKAQNEVGSDTCVCTVKLKEPPKFVTKINSISVVVGEPVELQATVEGSQPISVQWLKDKEDVVRESENTRITFADNVATLQLANAEPGSAGKYICQISNDAGTRECMATLTVLGW
uniref:Ig-like domain-containing protein n=1 Tax=Chelydra serpentina TaxID=8475 RepID=A0A8C3XMM8_CHESE